MATIRLPESQPCPPPHVGAEHCRLERRTIRPPTPQPPAFPVAASPLGDSPLALSNLEPVARIGLSLACNETCSRKPHSKVNSPDLLLRAFASLFPRPFRSKLHCLLRFAPSKAASPLLARRASRLKRRRLPSTASTPLQDSYIHPDQSVPRFRRLPGSPSVPPDSRSLPAALTFEGVGCGSSFPVRYFPETCCSKSEAKRS